jgi:hypothetical protein
MDMSKDELRTRFRRTVSQVDHLLAVGRKADRAVHIFNQLARCASQHRNLVEEPHSRFIRLALNEVQKVAVRREGERGITDLGRGHDLGVAAGGNMPHP